MNQFTKIAITAPLAVAITFGSFTSAFANELTPADTAPVASTTVASSAFGAAAETAPVAEAPVDAAPVETAADAPVLVNTPDGPVNGSTLPTPEPVGSTVLPGEAPVAFDTPTPGVDEAPVVDDAPAPVTEAPVVDAPVVPAPVEEVQDPAVPVMDETPAPVQDPATPADPDVPIIVAPVNNTFNGTTAHNTPGSAPILNDADAASGATFHNAQILVNGLFGVGNTWTTTEGTFTIQGATVIFTPAQGFAGTTAPITVQFTQTNADGTVAVGKTVVTFTVEAAPVVEAPTSPEAPAKPTVPVVGAPVDVPVKDIPAPTAPEAPVMDAPVADAAPVAPVKDEAVAAPVKDQGGVAPIRVVADPADASVASLDAPVGPVVTVAAPVLGAEAPVVPSVFADAAVAGADEAQVKVLPVGAPDTGVEVLADAGAGATGLVAGALALLAGVFGVLTGRKRRHA